MSYWNGFTGGDGPFMKQMVADFMKENPKIKVSANTVEWAQYYQRMPAAVTAGKGPDVGVMHLDQLATNAARKAIVPVDDLAKAIGPDPGGLHPRGVAGRASTTTRVTASRSTCTRSACTTTPTQMKKAGVSSAPTDEASFTAALDKLKASGQSGPFWMPNRWPAHLMFLSLLWQNGGEPFAGDGSKATYDSQAGVDALTWMAAAVGKYGPTNVAQDSQYVAFKNGKTSVTWDGIWQINDLKAAKVPFALAQIPTIGQTKAVWANSHNFYITRQASQDENKLQAAKVFIDWMSKKSAEWAGAGMVPARKSVRESAQVSQTTQAPIVEEIAQMKFLPADPRPARHLRSDPGDRRRRRDPRQAEAGRRAEGRRGQGDQADAGQQEEVRGLSGGDHPAVPERLGGGALGLPGALPRALRRVRPGAGGLRLLDQPARLRLHPARQAVRRPGQLRQAVRRRTRWSSPTSGTA